MPNYVYTDNECVELREVIRTLLDANILSNDYVKTFSWVTGKMCFSDFFKLYISHITKKIHNKSGSLPTIYRIITDTPEYERYKRTIKITQYTATYITKIINDYLIFPIIKLLKLSSEERRIFVSKTSEKCFKVIYNFLFEGYKLSPNCILRTNNIKFLEELYTFWSKKYESKEPILCNYSFDKLNNKTEQQEPIENTETNKTETIVICNKSSNDQTFTGFENLTFTEKNFNKTPKNLNINNTSSNINNNMPDDINFNINTVLNIFEKNKDHFLIKHDKAIIDTVLSSGFTCSRHIVLELIKNLFPKQIDQQTTNVTITINMKEFYDLFIKKFNINNEE